MLKQRLLTALVLAPAALACVFLLPLPWFEFFVAVAMVLGAWEWSRLAGFDGTGARGLLGSGSACCWRPPSSRAPGYRCRR
ncbi:phosphatidate cytidylyltransferase [Marinobacterium aestuariivivens]|uniref:Phosphatidate cytidylyltransferase n=1 Tax=Marinobacterium aestuariivivens TaxID=1698799 RepID=A0ABW1ZXZ5_9GAMM